MVQVIVEQLFCSSSLSISVADAFELPLCAYSSSSFFPPLDAPSNLLRSQNLTLPLMSLLTSLLPSGIKTMLYTGCWCHKSCSMRAPVVASHMRMVASSEPAARTCSSGEKATVGGRGWSLRESRLVLVRT